MKKHCLLLLLCISQLLATAAILRVGYLGTPVLSVDYPTLQLAHNAAKTGDTIQIYGINNFGGSGYSGEAVISKRLYIVGFGFNVSNNPNLQAVNSQRPSSQNGIIFTSGSQYSIIEGIDISQSYPQVSKLTFKRCAIQSWCAFQGAALDSILFLSCYINCTVTGGNPDHTNIIFANCLFSAPTSSGTLNYSANTTGHILNCVSTTFLNGSQVSFSNSKFLIRNCILSLQAIYSGPTANTIYENNFFVNAAPSIPVTGSNNRFSQVYMNLFTGIGGVYTNCANYSSPCFTESYYILKVGSPAINGGFDNATLPTDCGIFGGEKAWVYKLGCIPSIPAIYKLTSPSPNANTNPYNVTISVRSNN